MNSVLFSRITIWFFQDEIVKCDSYIYDKETFTDTLVMEHNLVCDAEWKQNVMGSFVSCLPIENVVIQVISKLFCKQYYNSLVFP
jgi:hypothetical protein